MIVREWWRERGRDNKTVHIDEHEVLGQIDLMNNSFNVNEVDEDRRRKLAQTINAMGDPCKTILTLFYWERNSMEAIAAKTGYKNEQGAKKKKYLCLEKLKKQLLD